MIRPLRVRVPGPRTRRLAGRALLAGALAFCGSAGWFAWQTDTDSERRFAHQRDQVLATGTSHIERLNTLDAASPEQDLAAWLDATTGPLHDELARTSDDGAAVAAQTGSTTRGTVTDAAVVELDPRTGTARLIATVDVDIAPREGAAATERKRFEAALTRTDGDWRISRLTALAQPHPTGGDADPEAPADGAPDSAESGADGA